MTNQGTDAAATITINGDTREVTIATFGEAAKRGTVYGLVSVIGRGKARYPASLTLWLVTDDAPLIRGNHSTTDSAGRVWQWHLQTVTRNQQARIVGFEDALGVTNSTDQTRK